MTCYFRRAYFATASSLYLSTSVLTLLLKALMEIFLVKLLLRGSSGKIIELSESTCNKVLVSTLRLIDFRSSSEFIYYFKLFTAE
jgi:hypothetical protein